ncbi:conserved hypothetical protein [Streptomyces sp. SPB78]|nr:conserved hypothetical protein [Streptomyces sp. SPB78]
MPTAGRGRLWQPRPLNVRCASRGWRIPFGSRTRGVAMRTRSRGKNWKRSRLPSGRESPASSPVDMCPQCRRPLNRPDRPFPSPSSRDPHLLTRIDHQV